jgi:hypothetical protein
MNRIVGAAGLMMLFACSSKQPTTQTDATPGRTAAGNRTARTVPPPGRGPDARTPLGQPASAIDPKSSRAAHALVQRYCELLKAGRFAEAHRLWLGDHLTDAEFGARWSSHGEAERCTASSVGPLEGAAGSVYTTVPVELSFNDGATLSGPLTLRRVNDVPGSTDEQRRWHIVKSDIQQLD